MTRLFCVLLLCGSAIMVIPAWSQPINDDPNTKASAHESKTTIEGLVRDIACPVRNLEAVATDLSMKCLLACEERFATGDLTRNGDLYLPISEKMPDEDQHQKLMPFLGKYMRASGTVYERNGTRAIAISKIQELKNVHLKIEDQ